MIPQQAAPSRMQTHRDFFSAYSFDTLISGAARLRPQAIALADRGASVPFDLLAGHASALARLLADSGLKPGERVLLTGGAEVSLVIAIVAALRGGFEPALAPLGLDAGELAAHARAIEAAALAGPTAYGTSIETETYLAAAALAPSIRLVATLGPQAIDGAVDLSTEAVLRYAAENPEINIERGKPAPSHAPRIITFGRGGKTPVIHQQATLMAASLDFIARASIGRETPKREAPRANRLKRRIAHAPSVESRPSESRQGIRFALGSGNAAMLRMTSRCTCGMCDSAQPKPIMPPQSCTASVTSPMTPACASSAVRSSTRDCSV